MHQCIKEDVGVASSTEPGFALGPGEWGSSARAGDQTECIRSPEGTRPREEQVPFPSGAAEH